MAKHSGNRLEYGEPRNRRGGAVPVGIPHRFGSRTKDKNTAEFSDIEIGVVAQ